jgi:cyclic di-GMP phosphodiesterase
MASVRPYRPAISRHHALQHIYAARDTLFQAEMVEQFQVCLGVYPTGSLVELNTGEVAVVMAQNQVRRLRPRVLVLSNPNKQPLTDFRAIDLMNPNAASVGTEIARSLAKGEYGIDAAEYFLQ